MDFSYKDERIEVGITDATADDVVKIMHELLGDQQPEIDQITARVKNATTRIHVSTTALQGATQQEN